MKPIYTPKPRLYTAEDIKDLLTMIAIATFLIAAAIGTVWSAWNNL